MAVKTKTLVLLSLPVVWVLCVRRDPLHLEVSADVDVDVDGDVDLDVPQASNNSSNNVDGDEDPDGTFLERILTLRRAWRVATCPRG